MRTLQLSVALLLATLTGACQQAPEWQPVDASYVAPGQEDPYRFPDAIAALRTGQAANYYSYLGDDERTAVAFGNTRQLTLPQGSQLTAARERILEGAEQTRLVIVNEAHHKPWHRAFTRSMLEDLYDRGYRHLGLEALTNHPQFLNPVDTSAVPMYLMGYYVREPELADLIRTAKSIGYTVFAYEETNQGAQPIREIGQARNIAEHMARFPEDKFLIHGGYDHVREGRMTTDWVYAMAQRLRDTTGIDPLTINQSDLMQRDDTDEVMVALNEDGSPFRPTSDSLNYMDLYLTHPVYQKANGRSGWKAANDRVALPLNLSTAPASPPYLLAAYHVGDDLRSTVPADLVMVEQATDRVVFYLPADTYTYVLRTADGRAWKTN